MNKEKKVWPVCKLARNYNCVNIVLGTFGPGQDMQCLRKSVNLPQAQVNPPFWHSLLVWGVELWVFPGVCCSLPLKLLPLSVRCHQGLHHPLCEHLPSHAHPKSQVNIA